MQYNKIFFVVPCTGRALGSLSPEITAISEFPYAVTSNGQQLRNLLLGKRIYCNLLDKETAFVHYGYLIF